MTMEQMVEMVAMMSVKTRIDRRNNKKKKTANNEKNTNNTDQQEIDFFFFSFSVTKVEKFVINIYLTIF